VHVGAPPVGDAQVDAPGAVAVDSVRAGDPRQPDAPRRRAPLADAFGQRRGGLRADRSVPAEQIRRNTGELGLQVRGVDDDPAP
jgi:hypothetical protein